MAKKHLKKTTHYVGIFTAVQQIRDAAEAGNRTKQNQIGEATVSVKVSFQLLEAFELGGSS